MAAPVGPFAAIPGFVPGMTAGQIQAVVSAALHGTLVNIQGTLAQIQAQGQPPVPAPEDHLVSALKVELVPSHLHDKFPRSVTWRLKLHVSFPPFWLVVASHKAVPLTRNDLWRDAELPGDWMTIFSLAVDEHYPELETSRKTMILSYFRTIMNLYVMYVPLLQAAHAVVPLVPANVRAITEQMIMDARPTLLMARDEFLEIEAEEVTLLHGAKSGAMYSNMTRTTFTGGMLGVANAMKQVTYHSLVGRSNLPSNQVVGDKLPGPRTCRKCNQQVAFAGFKAHNQICPGRGVAKKGAKPPTKKT